jgi:hypothetical protein
MYSLGVTAWWLLTDTYPFEHLGTAAHLVSRLDKAPHQLNPRVPLELSALVLRMLAERPEHRPSAREVAKDLRDMVDYSTRAWVDLLFVWETESSGPGPGRRDALRQKAELQRALHQRDEALARVQAEVERVRAERRESQAPAAAVPPLL